MEAMKKAFNVLMLMAFLFAGLGFAQPADAAGSIKFGICELYRSVEMLLGAVIFVLIVVAAVVYAAGQVMGAETRARASVWATSMIVGAIIGIIIFVLVPPILSMMMYGNPDRLEAQCPPRV